MHHRRVFAYGSNMHLADLGRWMRSRGYEHTVHEVRPAVLEGWGLTWNYRSPSRGAGAANVVRSEGDRVHGIVLSVDAQTLRAIDRKEGHPHRYRRTEESVSLRGGVDVAAWVYEVTAEWVHPEPVPPSRHYLDLMLAAARDHGLPVAWIDALATVHTHDPSAS